MNSFSLRGLCKSQGLPRESHAISFIFFLIRTYLRVNTNILVKVCGVLTSINKLSNVLSLEYGGLLHGEDNTHPAVFHIKDSLVLLESTLEPVGLQL